MANEEHLAILKQGVEVWNKWRQNNPIISPVLNGIKFKKMNFNHIDFSGTNLSASNIRETQLNNAILIGSNLSGIKLYGVSAYRADFSSADLRGADLKDGKFVEANLWGVDAYTADFAGSNLREASLCRANMSRANFNEADLTATNFREALLQETNFEDSKVGWTIFADTDISKAIGMEKIIHSGPSYIDIHTLYKSKGNIPDAFLKGAGIDDNIISLIPSLFNLGGMIKHYSCFISYSSKDEAFAKRIHADLQANNVRCWFAPHNLEIGAKTRSAIDEAIRRRDKLLIILSKNSIESDWVEKEVETAFEEERRRKKTVLFPVRIDDSVMKSTEAWAADIRRQRNIGDFRKWKGHRAYQEAFNRLLRDLCAEGNADKASFNKS